MYTHEVSNGLPDFDRNPPRWRVFDYCLSYSIDIQNLHHKKYFRHIRKLSHQKPICQYDLSRRKLYMIFQMHREYI